MPDQMPDKMDGVAAALTAEVTERLHHVAGNAAILGVVAVLALTVWGASVAGLVAVLAPLWGMAAALFFVALLVTITALILLYVLRRRVRLQQASASTRRTVQASVLAALPGVIRKKPGVLVAVSGLAIGAMIISALQKK